MFVRLKGVGAPHYMHGRLLGLWSHAAAALSSLTRLTAAALFRQLCCGFFQFYVCVFVREVGRVVLCSAACCAVLAMYSCSRAPLLSCVEQACFTCVWRFAGAQPQAALHRRGTGKGCPHADNSDGLPSHVLLGRDWYYLGVCVLSCGDVAVQHIAHIMSCRSAVASC